MFTSNAFEPCRRNTQQCTALTLLQEGAPRGPPVNRSPTVPLCQLVLLCFALSTNYYRALLRWSQWLVRASRLRALRACHHGFTAPCDAQSLLFYPNFYPMIFEMCDHQRYWHKNKTKPVKWNNEVYTVSWVSGGFIYWLPMLVGPTQNDQN